MGWKEVKSKVLQSLKDGSFQHDARNGIDVKNLLQSGQITSEEVQKILSKARGGNHSKSPHHSAPEIEVHVVTCEGWYIKFFFVDPGTMFISVHR